MNITAIPKPFSTTATGLAYDPSTGELSLTNGYVIPTVDEVASWNLKADYAFGANSFVGSGDFITDGKVVGGESGTPVTAIALAAGVTTFEVTKSFHAMTGDTGGNTIATITGGLDGQILRLLFLDNKITITDTDAATENTVNLSAAFTSSANAVLTLIFYSNKWYECGRSIN